MFLNDAFTHQADRAPYFSTTSRPHRWRPRPMRASPARHPGAGAALGDQEDVIVPVVADIAEHAKVMARAANITQHLDHNKLIRVNYYIGVVYKFDILPRTLADTLRRLTRSFPAIAITGPRQSGKATLARAIFPDKQ